MNIVVAILMFSLLVIIHEFGHFIFAIKGGITVEEFAIGMGPKIIGKKIKGVQFSIRALPFGGYCKMLGEDEVVEDENSYSSKSIWTRFKVIFGGPLFNFILAFVAIIGYIALSGNLTTTVNYIAEESPAEKAGIEIGDQIVKIGNHSIVAFKEVGIYLQEYKDETIDIVVKRDGERITLQSQSYFNAERNLYMLGINVEQLDTSNIFSVLGSSIKEMIFLVKIVYYSLGMLISGQVSANDIAGPIGLVSAVSTTYSESLVYGLKNAIATMLWFTGLLSTNLGVMNLLPIPALDGGRLVFLGIEFLRKKPVSQEKEGMIHFIGFVLLMGLMLLVFYNDIAKLFRA